MQPVRNKIAQVEYKGTLGLELEIVEGFAFLHFNLDKLSPSLVKGLRVELDRLLEILQAKGFDVLFFTSTTYQTVKFSKLIKPLFEVMELEDGTWLGSWLTFKEN